MVDIVVKDLEKEYSNGIRAINNINLKIKNQELLVIVGPSGCGKSTFLKMFAGLEKITRGEISIGCNIINNVLSKDRNMAMVFQNYALYPHLNIYENISFGLKIRNIPKTERAEIIKNIAEKLEISDLLNKKPHELSGGQKQRVALGRSLVRKPNLFLLDEPLSNLDTHLKTAIRLKIKQLHKELKTTTIYVTHDQEEAMAMGERIAVMKEGSIIQIDTPLNLYNYPKNKFVAGFIGSSKMNFIEVRVIVNDTGKILLRLFEAEIEAEEIEAIVLKEYIGKSIVLGIRPEHLFLDIEQENKGLLGKVIGKEALGKEETIYFDFYGILMTAKHITAKQEYKELEVNETFHFSISKYYLFDTITKSNLFTNQAI